VEDTVHAHARKLAAEVSLACLAEDAVVDHPTFSALEPRIQSSIVKVPSAPPSKQNVVQKTGGEEGHWSYPFVLSAVETVDVRVEPSPLDPIVGDNAGRGADGAVRFLAVGFSASAALSFQK
jgi:hypothetical protein